MSIEYGGAWHAALDGSHPGLSSCNAQVTFPTRRNALTVVTRVRVSIRLTFAQIGLGPVPTAQRKHSDARQLLQLSPIQEKPVRISVPIQI